MMLDGSLERTADGGHIVSFERVMDRPPERIWSTLTEPARLAKWLGDVEVDLRVGGAFVIRFHQPQRPADPAPGETAVMTGQITVLEPPRLIEYTWLEGSGMPSSLVRWEIVPLESGCRLKLTHRFPPGCAVKDLTSFLGGWHAFLDAIPSAAEGVFVPYADETELAAGYRRRYGADNK